MSTTNKQHIEQAIIAASEFIKSAKAALDDSSKKTSQLIWQGRKTGTMRRRSMDLSNALVKLRSSDHD